MLEIQSPLGIIAGNGLFPLEVARNARSAGIRVVAVLHQGESSEQLEAEVDRALWIKVGQLGTLLKFFKNEGVRDVVFAGGIRRINLFGGVKLDLRGVSLLAKLASRKDDALLRAVACEVEAEGMRVVGAHQLLSQSVAREGVLTHRALSDSEAKDVEVGIEIGRKTGDLEIGQAVVAFEGIVVAIEAVEGTDAMLRRAGELTKRRGGVVVKLCKRHQDLRLDLPTIGTATIRTMKESGLTALVVDAGKTLILEPVETVALANSFGIAVVAR